MTHHVCRCAATCTALAWRIFLVFCELPHTDKNDAAQEIDSLKIFEARWRFIRAAKISMMVGAAVLAFGLTSPMVTQGACFDEPCPAPRPAASTWTGWRSANFPTPNGGWLVFRIMPSGNPACASYNGSACLWGQTTSQIRFDRVRPLVCGADHRAKWGVTGYEDRKHWCNLARTASSTRLDDQ
jgi:hypothetical protein